MKKSTARAIANAIFMIKDGITKLKFFDGKTAICFEGCEK